MARLYANENFPLPVVQQLRELGHDVLTALDAGTSGQAIGDAEVLAFAVAQQRETLVDQLLRVNRPAGSSEGK